MEKPTYKFERKDWKPYIGYFNYAERNPDGSNENHKIAVNINRSVMLGYHIGLPLIGAITGLATLISK